MKSKLLIALILITVIFSSCKKDDDYSNPENLAVTEWKSFDKFTFDTKYSLFIDGNTITLTLDGKVFVYTKM